MSGGQIGKTKRVRTNFLQDKQVDLFDLRVKHSFLFMQVPCKVGMSLHRIEIPFKFISYGLNSLNGMNQ